MIRATAFAAALLWAGAALAGSNNPSPAGQIGVATGTSLALGGAALGSNVLAGTGTAAFSGAINTGLAAGCSAIGNICAGGTGASLSAVAALNSSAQNIAVIHNQSFDSTSGLAMVSGGTIIWNANAAGFGGAWSTAISRPSAGTISMDTSTIGDHAATVTLGGVTVGGTAGATCTLTTVAHLTVVNGVVTLCN